MSSNTAMAATPLTASQSGVRDCATQQHRIATSATNPSPIPAAKPGTGDKY